MSWHLPENLKKDIIESLKEDKLWSDIRRKAATNAALHTALERVKIIYYLIKDDGKKT